MATQTGYGTYQPPYSTQTQPTGVVLDPMTGQPVQSPMAQQSDAVQADMLGAATANYGGGWGSNWEDPSAQALQQAFNQGLTGQAAVDWVNANTPYGGQIAYYGDTGTYGAPSWYAAPNGPGGPLDLINRGGGGASGGGFGGGGGFNPITPTSGWSPDPRTNDLYNMLNTEATQNPIPSPNDPVIKAQTNAYNAQATRDMRNYMNELAEKGGPNANLGAQGMQAAEKVAQGAGQFQGTLMQNELNARRQQIQDALTGMGNLLSDQQRMQLQNQLAIMDNLLGQASLEQNAYAFDTTNANNTSPLAL